MANSTLILQAVDAHTAQVVSATYYVNGRLSTSPAFVPQGLSALVEAVAPGYATVSQTVVATAASIPVTIPLQPSTGGVTVQLQFYPALPGIAYTLTGPGSFSGTSTDGGTAAIGNVVPGTYQCAATFAGYTAAQETLEVGDAHAFSITLTKPAGSSQQMATGSAVVQYNPITDPNNVVLTSNVSEQVYDNSVYQGYFTSAQCQLYIGNLFIDELVVLQYALQQNTVPVYSYCSEFIDAYARGRSIVQGQIVINFVNQGYLYSALRNYQNQNQPLVASSSSQKIAALTKMTGDGTLDPNSQQAVAQQLSLLLLSATTQDVQDADSLLRTPNPTDPYAANPLYLNQVFTMRLEIGDGAYRSVRMFEDVKLSANEQIVSAQTGEVLGESYTFLARRLR